MAHGYKKFAWTAVTGLAGVGGVQQYAQTIWNHFVAPMTDLGIPAGEMTYSTPFILNMLAMLLVQWWVTEEDGERRLTREEIGLIMQAVNEQGARRGVRVRSSTEE